MCHNLEETGQPVSAEILVGWKLGVHFAPNRKLTAKHCTLVAIVLIGSQPIHLPFC